MSPPVAAAELADSIDQARGLRLWHAWRPLALVMMGVAVLRTDADPDLWGHVRFGLDTLRDRGLSRVDRYSFTQDRPWINHEWLSELQMGVAYAMADATGLMLLKGGLVLAVCVLIGGALRHVTPSWRWGATSIAVFGLLPIALSLRPHLWSLLLVVILCRTLLAGGRALYAIPALFVVWANVHGGWVVGLGILGSWTVALLVSSHTHPDARRLPLVAIAACLATLLTPYGLDLWSFIASTVRLGRENITEWQPVWRDSPVTLFAWALGVSFAAYGWRRFGRPPVPVLVIIAMLGVASLQVNRLVALFVPATIVLLSRQLPRAGTSRRADRGRLLVDAGAVTAALAAGVAVSGIPSCVTVSGPYAPDLTALASLDAAGPSGRMVTFFDWGEAALFHLAPDVTISIDGRRETIYSAATLSEQFAIAHGRPHGLVALERMRPEYVWLPRPRGNVTAEWLVGNGYRLDVDTSRSYVAVRADLSPIAQAAVPQSATCFPAGHLAN